jgi:hypothetical protein
VVYLVACALLTLALFTPSWTPRALAQVGATFVGPVGDSGAIIVVSTDGEQFTAYVCAGPQLADWFQGSLSVVSEAVSDGGSSFSMRFVSGAPAGTIVTPDGTEYAFTTQAVLPDPNAPRGELVEGGSGTAVSGSCSASAG